MSQEVFAFEAGLDRTFISMLERGQRLPSIATFMAVAKPLGLTGAQLMAMLEARLRGR
ncbi:transcriptional regulator with XRE-family HTH domain [Paraburkholderia sp. GAS334]